MYFPKKLTYYLFFLISLSLMNMGSGLAQDATQTQKKDPWVKFKPVKPSYWEDPYGSKPSFIKDGILTVNGALASTIRLDTNLGDGKGRLLLLKNNTEKFIKGNFKTFNRVRVQQTFDLIRVHRYVKDSDSPKKIRDMKLGPFGTYATAHYFKDLEKTQDNLALLSSWYSWDGGLAMYTQIRIPAGTELYVGGVAKQADGKEYRPGGEKLQFYIPRYNKKGKEQLNLSHVRKSFIIKDQYKK